MGLKWNSIGHDVVKASLREFLLKDDRIGEERGLGTERMLLEHILTQRQAAMRREDCFSGVDQTRAASFPPGLRTRRISLSAC